MLKHTIVALSLSILACDSPDDELMLEALDEEAELEANAELDAEARDSVAAASEQAPDASASARLTARAQTDESLDALAKAFARAVTDSNFRKQIHDGVAQRFDGDTEVLYKTLLKAPGVRDALASAYGRAQAVDSGDALGAVERLASAIPRFQVAVPANFDRWDPATFTPLVAFMPVSVEDTTLKTITAYDAAGKAHVLDAQVAPAQPVIVLGVNERTDDSGELLRNQLKAADQDPTAASAYQVRMVKVNIYNDNEPWAKGSAEISVRAQGCGLDYTDIDWTSLNDDEDWWYGPRVLGTTTCGVYFYWWEDDGSSYDFTLSYKEVSLNVKMDDGDDLIGGILLSNASFEGSSDSKSEWSDLVMWTD